MDILTPIFSMINEHFWYMLIIFTLMINRHHRKYAIILMLSNIIMGFKTFIYIIAAMLLIFEDGVENEKVIKIMHQYLNNPSEN